MTDDTKTATTVLVLARHYDELPGGMGEMELGHG